MIGHLRQWFQRLRSSLPSGNLDRELDAEIASHIELATEENIRRGMSEQEARRQALVRLGGMEQARQQQRDARGFYSIDVLMQDFRYAFRTVRRDPVFTAIAVLILAIGIGTNIAVFSVVNTILLRPLPLQNPQELVWIANADAKSGLSSMTYSVDAYQEYQSQTRSFQDITSYFAFSTGDNFKLMGHGQPLPFTAISVAGNFFQVLGVEPPLKRLFTADECLKNEQPTVLLSHAF